MINRDVITAVMQQRTFGQTDLGEVNLADTLLRDITTIAGTRPVSTREKLHVYDKDDGVWRELKENEALSLVQSYDGVEVGHIRKLRDGREQDYTAPLRMGSGRCKGILACALANRESLQPEFFEQAPRGVAFRNGFVTVTKDSVSLGDKSPDNRAIFCLPFDYEPDAPFDEWLVRLGRVFEGEEDAEDRRKLLQEFAGACMLGIATDYATCLVLLGEGANGKSVIAETIADLLFGEDAVTYTTPQSWDGRFSTSRLRSSRLNIAGELPDAEIQASDIFKLIIDGGKLDVEEKNKPQYTIRPRAGHMFLANAMPTTRDNSHGFWRRFLFLEFPRDFSKDPAQETKEAVKAKLKPEAAGIATWALHGAMRLLRQGKYTVPASHHRILRNARLSSDAVAAFVDECCEETGEELLTSIHEAFSSWCDKSGRKPVTNRKLAERLRSLGIKGKHTKHGAEFALSVLPRPEWAAGKSPRHLYVVGGDGR